MGRFIKVLGVQVALAALVLSASASAVAEIYTATISSEGKVIAQSPRWIKAIKLSAQPDYFSDYKVRFIPGLFKEAPRFCSASVTDVSSNDHVFYGHAKLGGLPSIDYMNVLTLRVGDNKPAGDSSMGFLLMCVK